MKSAADAPRSTSPCLEGCAGDRLESSRRGIATDHHHAGSSQHCVQLVWSRKKSQWKQARGRSQVYLCTNTAILVLCVSAAVQLLGGTAAGKVLCQLPCLLHTHCPNTGLPHGDVSFGPQASLASTPTARI